MPTLAEAKGGQIYYIAAVKDGPRAQKLRELGFLIDQEVTLATRTETGAIVKLKDLRLALTDDFLSAVEIKNERDEEIVVGLSALTAGETGVVRFIDALPATKSRLMDMGLTRGVKIFVRKLAPLGDPMELHVRGYALSLRKADAETIKVVKEDD